jgi:nucleotide-binding universal stress UspA family protein
MKTLTARKIEAKPLTIRRIIAALDLRRSCRATVRYAAQIARHYHASLCLTYVFWPAMLSQGDHYYLIDQEQREFRHQLDHLVQEVRRLVPGCKSAFLVGEPAERIASLARDAHADLIITTSYDPKFFTELFKLNNAIKLVHQASCPVLVYHEVDR